MSDFERYTLADWLVHIQTRHWRSIDLTLDRVARVWANLEGQLAGQPSGLVIAVAGTNGKGSCVAMLDAVLRDAGLKTGSYTSPHLVRYNERVRISGRAADDAALCAAFVEIERARDGIPLTYFEFGTLCALMIFRRQGVEVSILEVGMGGRLDAVNLIANDIALITSIGIDHARWLGEGRAAIAVEKAGILKENALAVCTDPAPPPGIARIAAERNCTLLQAGVDYAVEQVGEGIRWRSDHRLVDARWRQVAELRPPLGGVRQLDNLGGVIAVLALTRARTGRGRKVTEKNLRDGLANTRLMARCQVIDAGSDNRPEIVLDVAHNLDSATHLAAFLARRKVGGRPAGVTHGVFGMLADKPVAEIIAVLAGVIDRWYLATLAGERGQTAEALNAHLQKQPAAGNSSPATLHDSPVAACLSAMTQATARDRVVIFGSFCTIGDIIAHFEHDGDWAADALH